MNGVLAAGFIALCSFENPCRAQTNPEMRATALLFQQFETVVYTSTEIPSDFDAANSDEAILRYPFVALLAGLKNLGPNTIRDLERSYSPILVGAKDFIGPDGLGAVSSHECYIGLLRDGKQPNLAGDFREAKSERIEGKVVWTWEMAPYEGHKQPTTFYLTQVADSYFVMANDRQNFQEVIKKLTSAEIPTNALANIRGWNTFRRISIGHTGRFAGAGSPIPWPQD